jgi:hypothetical protein
VPKFLSASLLYDSIFNAEVDESNIKLKKNIRKGSREAQKPHVHDPQATSQLATTTATTQMKLGTLLVDATCQQLLQKLSLTNPKTILTLEESSTLKQW